MRYLEALARVVAFFMGLVFLFGFLNVWKTEPASSVLALSHTALMFLSGASPLHKSRAMLAALIIALVLAGVDFFVRALPSLRTENYPLDIVAIYVIELAIAAWFISKHVPRTNRSASA